MDLVFIYPSVTEQYTQYISSYLIVCLQCFDAVGWAAGRAYGL